MIKVTLEEIKNKFDELIDEKLSRAEVSDWALERERANDDELLEYYPHYYRPVIWDAIIYLTGVDLPTTDREYLFCKQDFIDYQKQLFNEQSSIVKDLFSRDDKFREAEKEVLALEEKYPNRSDRFYMEQTDKILEKKGLLKRL